MCSSLFGINSKQHSCCNMTQQNGHFIWVVFITTVQNNFR